MATSVVMIGVLAAQVASGAPASVAQERPSSLRALSTQYQRDDREEAVATIGLWTQSEVEAETERLIADVRQAAKKEPSRKPQPAIVLRTPTVLLADAALRALRQGDPGRARWELTAATRLVRAMPTAGDDVRFIARFYVLSGSMRHFIGDLAGAYEAFSEGRRRAEDDPELLLGLGAVIETAAALRTYAPPPDAPRQAQASREDAQFVIEGEHGAGGRLPRTTLVDAEAAFRKALLRDPGLLEAHLRLGRVLLLRGMLREALAELERVGVESKSPRQAYMAKMFEGRCRERLADPQGAAAAFGAAAERVPRAQAAAAALGRALGHLGEEQRAEQSFDDALRPEAVRDPWLEYIKGRPDRIDDAVSELRRLIP